MSWLVRLLQKAARLDPADVFNQQTGDDILNLLKELIP